MPKYRKRPVVIEARGPVSPFNAEEIALWISGRMGVSIPLEFNALHPTITIPTLEGDMRAEEGDYIIRGVKGEFYPCKPEIFEATYEPA